jgi:N-acetylglucosaminyldiphosphoundecaprenol N-acetyl-beta-D-mannosaminyltransferase
LSDFTDHVPTPSASRQILGTRVDAIARDAVAPQVFHWVEGRGPHYVCVCNVHLVMEANDDAATGRAVAGADLVTPDGVPLVWGLHLLGLRDAERVHGPWLLPHLCEEAARRKVPVGFYGGTPQVLADLIAELRRRSPDLEVAYQHSPPFRGLSEEEDGDVVREIVASGARILFVGLGCPSQERWMAAHRERLPLVMLGVGAAFDFVSGHKREAPMWMQQMGLGWLFRLACEPRRLWYRYAYHNPRFLAGFARQWLASFGSKRLS